MESATWISIYMPIFILLFVIAPRQRELQRAVMMRIRKRKGQKDLMNELVRRYMGKNCVISTGSLGVKVTGRIVDVSENWIEIETKKGNELINAEFIQNIKIKS